MLNRSSFFTEDASLSEVPTLNSLRKRAATTPCGRSRPRLNKLLRPPLSPTKRLGKLGKKPASHLAETAAMSTLMIVAGATLRPQLQQPRPLSYMGF